VNFKELKYASVSFGNIDYKTTPNL